MTGTGDAPRDMDQLLTAFSKRLVALERAKRPGVVTALQRIWERLNRFEQGPAEVIDLTPSLRAGFTGTVSARVVGMVVEITGSASGSFPSGSTTTELLVDLPARIRPAGDNRFGSAWGGGYAGNLIVRPAGTGGLAQRSGAEWTSTQFSITYLRGS